MNGIPVNTTAPPNPPWGITALISLGIAAFFAPVLYRMAVSFPDYQGHTQLAAKMIADKAITTPHFLFHALLSALHLGLQISLDLASFLTILGAVAATAALLFILLYRTTGSTPSASLFAFGLLLAMPIALLAPADYHLYFGYIGINVYHNPTIILLKPLALALFFIVCRSFIPEAENNGALIGSGALLTVLAASAKPSYTICLIPALLLLVCYFRYQRAAVNWKLLTFGALLPSVIILAVQYYLTYSAAQLSGLASGDSRIVVAPLIVMRSYSEWLAPKFLLSILYPLAVSLCYRTSLIKEPHLACAWLCFACGAAYTYLLAEAGPRIFHGNFSWSAQITLFILVIVSTDVMLKRLNPMKKLWLRDSRALLCLGLFTFQSIFGILFYVAEFTNSKKFW